MKQAQSGTTRITQAGRRWTFGGFAPHYRTTGDRGLRSQHVVAAGGAGAWAWGRAVLGLLSGAWFVVTLPFRLAFWMLAWLGRLTGIALGFTLMVAGMFFLAGPLFLIGIPLFFIGLVLTLRCLD
jgi:hypothetical protein